MSLCADCEAEGFQCWGRRSETWGCTGIDSQRLLGIALRWRAAAQAEDVQLRREPGSCNGFATISDQQGADWGAEERWHKNFIREQKGQKFVLVLRMILWVSWWDLSFLDCFRSIEPMCSCTDGSEKGWGLQVRGPDSPELLLVRNQHMMKNNCVLISAATCTQVK